MDKWMSLCGDEKDEHTGGGLSFSVYFILFWNYLQLLVVESDLTHIAPIHNAIIQNYTFII